MTWAIFFVALAAFAFALLPTRRLSVAGWRPAPLVVYLCLLVALAVAAVFLRAGTRVLVPILLVLYILPFVGAPESLARVVARLGAGRGPRPRGPVVDGVARRVDDVARPADETVAPASTEGDRSPGSDRGGSPPPAA